MALPHHRLTKSIGTDAALVADPVVGPDSSIHNPETDDSIDEDFSIYNPETDNLTDEMSSDSKLDDEGASLTTSVQASISPPPSGANRSQTTHTNQANGFEDSSLPHGSASPPNYAAS